MTTDDVAAVVGPEQIARARELLRGVARLTPVEGSRPLSELVGGPVALKCENLQRTGSFKIRGAFVRISGLSDEERSRGVVAASAGNHAQGVALAATLLHTQSTVFMPEGAPIPKVEATKAYGADVRFAGISVDEALDAAGRFAAETGAVLIHPFDHPDIVAGQGTVSQAQSSRRDPTSASSVCRPRALLLIRRHSQPVRRHRWAPWRRWPTASRWAVPAG
jgi:threonine dehydratase